MDDNNSSRPKKALDYAIRLLTLRDYSKHKMTQKLKERDFDISDIDYVIEKLEEYNYLRESEYTLARIKQLLVKGYSNSYIIKKIAQEKLTTSNEAIDKIRNEQNLNSDSQIQNLIEKKIRFKSIPTDFDDRMKLKRKLTNYLVSKGHNYNEINAAIDDALKEDD